MKYVSLRQLFAWIVCVAATAACALPATAASFEPLGQFWAVDVTDDGNSVVGTDNDPAAGGGQVIARWTPATGVRTVAWASYSEHTTAIAVSGDGSAIIGSDYNADAVYWTQAGGLRRLLPDEQPGLGGYARAVSRDGRLVTGHFTLGRPFLWTAGAGAAPLPLPAGYDRGAGNAFSADGSVIAGTADDPYPRRAFRWTAASGSTLLDQAPGIVGSDSTAISADGSTVVGWAFGDDEISRPFRWTEAGGMQVLGPLPGGTTTGSAADVSGDGSVVVGTASSGPLPGQARAFIWDESHGMRELASVLASDYGLDLSGWTLLSAKAITPDGLTIVGQASHPQLGGNVAYRVVLPEPSGALATVGFLACLLRRRRASA